jgi:hypothetical protein
MFSRLLQVWLIVSTLLLSWLLMEAVHEFGHAVGAWITGGRLVRTVLHPLAISRTDIEPNPHPVIVVWAGPLVGTALPALAWGLFAAAKLPTSFLRFFAGFCLIANGAYIGVGSVQRIGDCGVMLRHGSPIWALWLFGTVTIPAGLWLLDGTRDYFGLGKRKSRVNSRAIIVTSVALSAVLILEVAIIPRQ